jgi:hypothetical protein
MTTLQPRERQHSSARSAPAPADRDVPAMARRHESIARLLASRGQWRQAYEHLRAALELRRVEQAEARELSLRDSLTHCSTRRSGPAATRWPTAATARCGSPGRPAVAARSRNRPRRPGQPADGTVPRR